jgi:hypothetical protein
MPSEVSRARMLFGTTEPVTASRLLRAGPLTVELSNGNLRNLCWHGNEAIRGISYLVRDENWGTYAPSLTDVRIDENETGFRVSYKGECRASSGAILAFNASIEGRARGTLVFDMGVVPNTEFSTNRCGFCILHPIIGVAGKPARVEHVNGTIEVSSFPELIDPAQPFFDIRTITHEVTPGVNTTCRMEGDAFEMEDQRNWTDASYKTYVRPLALPWPYILPANVENRQSITVSISGTSHGATRVDDPGEISVSLGEARGQIAKFGLGIAPEDIIETLANIERLSDIGPHHLTLHFDPLSGHDKQVIADYAKLLQAFPVDATLEYVLSCKRPIETEISELARLIDKADLKLSAISVSPDPDRKSTPPGSRWPECMPLGEIYAATRKHFPNLALGGGMFSYFTEFNRKRPPTGALDFVTHTTSPLVHAADDRSVMETLEALPFVTRSVRAIAGNMPYRIGPSAIGMRHNPYGASLAANPDSRRMTMTASDPRQKGLFAAAWMIGYAAATASAGLELLTLGCLTGQFGVVDEDGILPAYHAARMLAQLQGMPARCAGSSDATRLLAIAGGDMIAVANISGEEVAVKVPHLQQLQLLDESTAPARQFNLSLSRHMNGCFTLGAYGIALCVVGVES